METVINVPTGNLLELRTASLSVLQGGGRIGRGELWGSIKDTLNVYTECVHNSDWVDHKIGLCVHMSLTWFVNMRPMALLSIMVFCFS